MKTFYFFLVVCVCLASSSPPLLRSEKDTDAESAAAPAPLINSTSDTEIPESTAFTSVSKMPLAGGLRTAGSVTSKLFKEHTRGSKKVHDSLEHVMKQLDDKNSTISLTDRESQRQSMLILVEQALELMRLTLTTPPKP